MKKFRGYSNDWSRCAEGFASLRDSEYEGQRGQTSRRKQTGSLRPTRSPWRRELTQEHTETGCEKQDDTITWSSSDTEDSEEQESSFCLKETRKRQKAQNYKPNKRRSIEPRKIVDKYGATSAVDDVDIEESDGVSPESFRHDQCTPPTVASSGSLKDDAIQGFESESEARTPEKNRESLTQGDGEEDSPAISGSTCSPSQSGQGGAVTGLRASDWVKTLQLKTPSKSDTTADQHGTVEDSAKKKKKHTKGGLAEQFSKLQAREKSSVRMWSHQQGKSLEMEDSSSVRLKILGWEVLYSLQFARCEIRSGPDTGTHRLVMFPVGQAEQLNLQPNTVMAIAPPWQQLELSNQQQLLLCTKFCRVLEQPIPELENDGLAPDYLSTSGSMGETVRGRRTEQPGGTVKARWSCPCVSGLCRSHTACLAFKFPNLPGILQTQKQDESQSREDNSDLTPHHLHTVTADISSTAPKISDSILECIERSGDGRGQLGVMCFRGLVHRAACWREARNKSWRLLVEDGQGTMCQVTLSMEDVEKCRQTDLAASQGRAVQLSGLKVASRITRERDPGLFSLLDRVWFGSSRSVVSQDSETAEFDTGSTMPACAPEFCYVLVPDDRYQPGIQLQPAPGTAGGAPVMPLHQAEKLDTCKPVRWDCVARLLHAHYPAETQTCAALCVLYLMDGTVSGSRYIRVHVEMSCDMTVPTVEANTVVKLWDLYSHQGDIYADGYSRVTTVTDDCSTDLKPFLEDCRSLSVQLPALSDRTQPLCLCSVTGRIQEVDEGSAYSWDACSYCGSDQLQERDTPSGVLTCGACERPVPCPVTSMKMEVLVSCGLNQASVKVDLRQETIESLLPTEDVEEDGYELSSVLNKAVGPLQCCVVSHSTTDRPQYLLEEIKT